MALHPPRLWEPQVYTVNQLFSIWMCESYSSYRNVPGLLLCTTCPIKYCVRHGRNAGKTQTHRDQGWDELRAKVGIRVQKAEINVESNGKKTEQNRTSIEQNTGERQKNNKQGEVDCVNWFLPHRWARNGNQTTETLQTRFLIYIYWFDPCHILNYLPKYSILWLSRVSPKLLWILPFRT